MPRVDTPPRPPGPFPNSGVPCTEPRELLIQLIQKVDLLLSQIERYDGRVTALEDKVKRFENELTSVS